MQRSMRTSVGVGVAAGVVTALAVFGGTSALLAGAQDTPDTTTQSPGTSAPDEATPGDTAPGGAAPDAEQAPSDDQRRAEMDAWRQCMADNGVELPEPPAEGDPGPRPERPRLDEAQRDAFEKAVEACGRPPFGPHGHHGGHGRGGPRPGCDDEQHGSTAPEQQDQEPQAEGSSYSA